jgi:hypothetical protein
LLDVKKTNKQFCIVVSMNISYFSSEFDEQKINLAKRLVAACTLTLDMSLSLSFSCHDDMIDE